MSLTLPPRFLCELRSLRWRDVRWGLHEGLISPEGVVAYAICKLDETSSDAEYAIAQCDPKNPWALDEAINRAAEDETSDEDAGERWLFAALMQAFEESQSVQEFLAALEEAYGIFGYPDNLAPATVSGFPGRVRPTKQDLTRQRDSRVRFAYNYLRESAARFGARPPHRAVTELLDRDQG